MRRGVALLILWLAMPASASAAPPTTGQAQRAVQAEVRATLDLQRPRATCKRLTAKRWKCSWTARSLIGEPVCSGTARATRYRYSWDVKLTNESTDTLC